VNPVFAFRFSDSDGRDVLLTFMATADFDEDSLADTLDTELKKRVPDEWLILVRETSFVGARSQFAKSTNLKTLLQRMKNSNAFLLGYDQSGAQASIEQLLGERGLSRSVESLKRRALTHIFKTYNGFVEANPQYHFRNPSGRHAERFLRLSNILKRGAEISFMAYCALPFINPKTKFAYLDTPSLYALVAAVNDQLRTFIENFQPIIADNFQSYGASSFVFTRITESIAIISASTSGGLAEELLAREFTADRIFHFLFLGPNSEGQRIVCDLARDDENPEGFDANYAHGVKENCPLCLKDSFAIPLLGDQFEFGGPQIEPLVLKQDFAPRKLSVFLNEVVGFAILQVGLSPEPYKEPRQYFVSAGNLLGSARFRKKLQFHLDRSVPGKVGYIVHIDDHSLAYATLARECLRGNDIPLLGRNELAKIDPGTTSPIVIVTAVAESGRTLQDLSRDLRVAAPNASLIYIVGLLKTDSESSRDRLEKTLVKSNTQAPHICIFVDEIFLPPSDVRHAWAAELDVLQNADLTSKLDELESQAVELRRQRLRRTSEPLTVDLFLKNNDKCPLPLRPGFVYWNDALFDQANHAPEFCESDVFYTIASVLQNLRSKRLIRANWFQQTILHPENFDRYNDGMIQASLLRAANVPEINYSLSAVHSEMMRDRILRIITSAGNETGEAAAEFLLSLASGRMKLQQQDLITVATAMLPTGFPLLTALQKYCLVLVRLDTDSGHERGRG
jgi:hypothetical protein